ncbi:MAG: hypothetical protein EBZ49_17790, partial [Proteobacteria bacterium]|nr:hypothetical protein [Pseudomonadota bacterium]
MRLLLCLFCGILSFAMSVFSATESQSSAPLPVPRFIRIENAARREQVWNRLGDKEKRFAFHLLEAAR